MNSSIIEELQSLYSAALPKKELNEGAAAYAQVESVLNAMKKTAKYGVNFNFFDLEKINKFAKPMLEQIGLKISMKESRQTFGKTLIEKYVWMVEFPINEGKTNLWEVETSLFAKLPLIPDR